MGSHVCLMIGTREARRGGGLGLGYKGFSISDSFGDDGSVVYRGGCVIICDLGRNPSRFHDCRS